ncbi:MAG: cellulase family glycosylhydrolase [Reichenbachiella sp.]
MTTRHNIIRRTILFLLALTFIFSNIHGKGLLHRDGTNISNDDGPIILRGLNIGNWLFGEGYLMNADIEGYKTPTQLKSAMIDLLDDTEKYQEFHNAWRDNFFNESDVKLLKEDGFNSFRILFQYKDLYDTTAGELIEDGIRYLDSCAIWGERNDMYMIFDMHGAPGGQNYMDHADVPSEAYKLFTGTPEDFSYYSALTATIWKKIAQRFSEAEYIAYDLINEPLIEEEEDHALLQTLHHMITDSIRSVDQNHLIIAEGNWWGSWLEPLGDRWDDNMAYSTHNYWNKVPSEGRDGQQAFGTKQDAPIWHGESGENSNVWYAIEIADLESRGIGWAWWTFKKLKSVTGVYSANEDPGYKAILDYWGADSATVSSDDAFTYLMNQAIAMNTSNCQKNISVVDALLRPDFLTKSVPYNYTAPKIPSTYIDYKDEEHLEKRLSIRASHYDMGNQGVAYFDSNYFQTNAEDTARWNEGWVFRNDGVDVTPNWVDKSQEFVGHIQKGEWINYTFEVIQEGPILIQLATASENEGTATVKLDGAVINESVSLLSGDDWIGWKLAEVGEFDFSIGTYTLTIQFNMEDVNFDEIKLTYKGELSTNSESSSDEGKIDDSSFDTLSSSTIESSTIESASTTNPISSSSHIPDEQTSDINTFINSLTVHEMPHTIIINTMATQTTNSFKIVDTFGVTHRTVESNQNLVTIEKANLPAGAYILLIEGTQIQAIKSFIAH